MKNFAILPTYNQISNNDEIVINLNQILFIEKTTVATSICTKVEKYFINFSTENKIQISKNDYIKLKDYVTRGSE